MKNIVLGVLIVLVLSIGTYYVVDYNIEEPVSEEEMSTRDVFGVKYSINNEHFVISSPSEIINLIDSEDTLVVFVGRPT